MDVNTFAHFELRKVEQNCLSAESKIRLSQKISDVVRHSRIHVQSWLRPLARTHLSAVDRAAERRIEAIFGEWTREAGKIQGADLDRAVHTMAQEAQFLRGHFPRQFHLVDSGVAKVRAKMRAAIAQAPALEAGAGLAGVPVADDGGGEQDSHERPRFP